MKCATCGYRASLDWIAMADICPNCHASPFPEAQPDRTPE